MTEDEKMELRLRNEEALRNLGCEPGTERAPRRVDFQLVFATEADRSTGKAAVCDLGFDWENSDDPIDPETFEATAYKVLSPDLDGITDSEIALTEVLRSSGGYVDGWGYFGDTVH